jgi:hypothetical protein
MNPAGEGELIARCRRGEAAAWDELFDRHYDATARFVFQLGHDLTREDNLSTVSPPCGTKAEAHQLFGERLPKLLDELNTVLAA